MINNRDCVYYLQKMGEMIDASETQSLVQSRAVFDRIRAEVEPQVEVSTINRVQHGMSTMSLTPLARIHPAFASNQARQRTALAAIAAVQLVKNPSSGPL